MQDEHALTLRQIDQAGGDLYRQSATISNSSSFSFRDCRLVKDQARNALGIIFATALLTALSVLWFTACWQCCL